MNLLGDLVALLGNNVLALLHIGGIHHGVVLGVADLVVLGVANLVMFGVAHLVMFSVAGDISLRVIDSGADCLVVGIVAMVAVVARGSSS